MIKPGYYFKLSGEIEFLYVSGKDTGNKFYNPDADEPRWALVGKYVWAQMYKDTNFDEYLYSKEDPVPHYVSGEWEKFCKGCKK